MSFHRKATSRGMKRWWAKKKDAQDFLSCRIESAIKQGLPTQKMPNLEALLKAKKLRVEQAESLKKLMEKYVK